MPTVEDLLRSLCRELTPHLKPLVIKRPKWIVLSGQTIVREVIDIQGSRTAILRSHDVQLNSFPPYLALVEGWINDPVLKTGERLCSSWGRPDSLISRILENSLVDIEMRPRLDDEAAVHALQGFRDALSAEYATFTATARLLNVRLAAWELQLADNLSLVLLSDEELTAQQRFLDDFFPMDPKPHDLSEHRAEIRHVISVPIDRTKEEPIWDADTRAGRQAADLFEDVLTALRLRHEGQIGMAPIEMKGQITLGGTIYTERYTKSIIPHPDDRDRPISINERDVPELKQWLKALPEIRARDRVLRAAIRRFILGTQRQDVTDAVVDYVIAWEAILLSVKGNPISGELSYRFRMNGAALLAQAGIEPNPETAFKILGAAYNTRSAIVHGGADEDILKKAHVPNHINSIEHLTAVLGRHLRRAAAWLANLHFDERPYRADGGWENLIWKSPIS